MNTQTLFRVGNSDVVAIPRAIFKELRLKTGQKVVVDKVADSEVITISPTTAKKNPVNNEFNKWLKNFLEEDKALLDELAER